MPLKEYEIPNGAGGTTTFLLSEEDAKARGLIGGVSRSAKPEEPDTVAVEIPVKSKVRSTRNK